VRGTLTITTAKPTTAGGARKKRIAQLASTRISLKPTERATTLASAARRIAAALRSAKVIVVVSVSNPGGLSPQRATKTVVLSASKR